MRRTMCIILWIIGFFLAEGLYAQSNAEAVEHFQEVGTAFNDLKGETWQYLKAVTRGKGARKVENKRQKLLSEIRSVKAEIKGKKAYMGDNSLKTATIRYLDLTYKVLNEDFDKILDMEDIAEQSYDMMEAYLLAKEIANEKLDSASAMVHEAELNYAEKYHITLTEGKDDKITQKIRQANETLAYYNDIYLIFFKSYKQEVYVLDALQRNDVSALEQNTSTLSAFSAEGLEKLKGISNYRGDPSLKAAAQQILHFYRNEAERDFPAMVDFYLKKDNFEKVQKMVESKSKKSRTQEDIDQYNQAADEYNKAAQRFNTLNEMTFNQRIMYIEQWNEKVERFLDIHSS